MQTACPRLVVAEAPDRSQREILLRLLVAFNESRAGAPGGEPVAILLTHPITNATIGGLWGWSAFGWLHIETLFVPAQFRGMRLGWRLLEQAEEIALTRGCAGVWLDTFGFQARGFYEKHGYRVFGTLDGDREETQRFFLRKSLKNRTLPP